MWKSRDKDRGKRRAEGTTSGQSDRRSTRQDNPLDEQKTCKLETSSVEASDRPRQSNQKQRNEDRQKEVLWEKSLSLWDGQRKKRESVGGSGQ